MQNQYSRTQLLLGAEAMEKLHNSRVAVFGIGGVGGYTVEALARSGVGALDLIDDDKVCLTNLNRQIIATRSTVGQYKVDVAAQRIHDIDPDIKVTTHRCFFGPETQDQFDFTQYDYVVDAIDTVTGKLALVMKCKEAGTPIICSMGAGNKMDPTRFEVTDIYKTSVCPLAKVMRTECRKRKIKHLKVVYSKEPAMTPIEDDAISCKYHCICPPGTQRKCTQRRSVPGSNAFVPSVGWPDHRRRGGKRPCGLCTDEGLIFKIVFTEPRKSLRIFSGVLSVMGSVTAHSVLLRSPDHQRDAALALPRRKYRRS